MPCGLAQESMNRTQHTERRCFSPGQIENVQAATRVAEEMVSDAYKMSPSQWRGPKYDVRTLAELNENEIVSGPFAQIVRYRGVRKNSGLTSDHYDFYKICLQDHTILDTVDRHKDLALLPFSLYIMTHELIHVVRFGTFMQNFEATAEEKAAEEHRVHQITHQILGPVQIGGIEPVLDYYRQWTIPVEEF